MLALLSLSPIAVTVVAALGLRRPPMEAAMLGTALAGLLWAAGWGDPFSLRTIYAIAIDTSVVFASVATIVVLGVAFVMLAERSGAATALAAWTDALALTHAERIVFVTLGVAVMLESLTGAGVSLVVTVPLLMRRLEPTHALPIALASMCIMPWGNLGLPTTMGAILAHVDVQQLGRFSASVEGPVFLGFLMWALWVCGGRDWRGVGLAGACGALFVAVLWLAVSGLGPDVAGIIAGAAILGTGLLASTLRTRSLQSIPRTMWPYIVLVASVVINRVSMGAADLKDAIRLHGVQVDWYPLTSPVLPLVFTVSLLKLVHRRECLVGWNGRVRRPLLTTLAFLLLSQCLVKTGLLAAPIASVAGLGALQGVAIVALAGGLSGYVTGSNIAANAIVMPSLAGFASGMPVLIAAVQNCAAGLGAMGSLPMIALIAGIARLEGRQERDLTKFGLVAAALGVATVACAGLFTAAVGAGR